MPVGLAGAGAGGSGSTVNNSRSGSFNPGHTTELIYSDPKAAIDLMRLGGSRPTWDRYGFFYTEEYVNPPAGSEAPAIYSKIRLFVNNSTEVQVAVKGI